MISEPGAKLTGHLDERENGSALLRTYYSCTISAGPSHEAAWSCGSGVDVAAASLAGWRCSGCARGRSPGRIDCAQHAVDVAAACRQPEPDRHYRLGPYSGRYNWLSDSGAWTIKKENSVSTTTGGNPPRRNRRSRRHFSRTTATSSRRSIPTMRRPGRSRPTSPTCRRARSWDRSQRLHL